MATEAPAMDQGLLTKNPSLTDQEFSDHWFNTHAQIVIPFFLHSGIPHYEQIHGPLTSTQKTTPITSLPSNTPLDLATFSGAVGFPPSSDFEAFISVLPKWKRDYYEEVIKADERKFLVKEAMDCIVRVKPESVVGDRRVIIEGGKVLVGVDEVAMGVWREYLAREGEEEKA